MKYIAALDYEHLDNGVFLTSLARSLSDQQKRADVRSIIIHSDSEYTERIIQTGVMREDAKIRSIKDLNNRLVALFADQGVSTIGINPARRKCLTIKDNELKIDTDFINSLPEQSVLLMSTLVYDEESDKTVAIDTPRLLAFLKDALNADELFIFNKTDEAEIFTGSDKIKDLEWNELDQSYKSTQIPDEFENLSLTVRLTSGRDFSQIPDLDNTILIKASQN